VDAHIEAALAAGALALTPNRRLARRLSEDYAKSQRAVGAKTWESPLILPWSAWLDSLWWDAVELGGNADMPRLLSQQQAAHAWERIVARDRSLMSRLLNPNGTAQTAFDAWQLVHAWSDGGSAWRAWTEDTPDEGGEPGAFARWCEGFTRLTARAGVIDIARFPDLLIARLETLAAALPRRVLLVGFIELTPQQQRLASALQRSGVDVSRVSAATPALASSTEQRRCETAREETVAALRWARDVVVATPSARVAIAIEDLAHRRSEIVALATDILAPRAWLEGAEASEGIFDVSLGVPLATIPLVSTALDLIGLASRRLEMGRAAALVRSP
jgi:ATP-dependent helicase/nuclease subunit B